MVYGGILEKCGVLDVLLEKMHSFTKTVGRLVATTVCLEIFLNLITASQYMTIILGGKLMMPAYRSTICFRSACRGPWKIPARSRRC